MTYLFLNSTQKQQRCFGHCQETFQYFLASTLGFPNPDFHSQMNVQVRDARVEGIEGWK